MKDQRTEYQKLLFRWWRTLIRRVNIQIQKLWKNLDSRVSSWVWVKLLSDKWFCTIQIILLHYLNHSEYWIFQFKVKIESIGLRICLINYIIFCEKLHNFFEHILTRNSEVKFASSPPPIPGRSISGFPKVFILV